MSTVDDMYDPDLKEFFESYDERFSAPSPETIKRWKREKAARLAAEGQLSFSFVEKPGQQASLFPGD